MLCLPKTCPPHTTRFCLQGLMLYLRIVLLKLASPTAFNVFEDACLQVIGEAVSHSWLGSK